MSNQSFEADQYLIRPKKSHTKQMNSSYNGGDCIDPVNKKEINDLFYHHCIPVEQVIYGTIRPDRNFSYPDFLSSYEWVERETGFFPVFYAVGPCDRGILMTGYSDNWMVWTGGDFEQGVYKKKYRKRGEFPNLAVFSFDQIDGVFMDYMSWHIALNAYPNGRTVTPYERRMIFKPSWTCRRWWQAALKGTHSVQLVAPELPLHRAGHVYVRNSETKRHLERMGFTGVEVLRVRVEKI
jgi:hypothetical protein